MILNVEQSVEWELARETEVPGENLSQCHFLHYKSHITWPGLEPGPPPELWHGLSYGVSNVPLFVTAVCPPDRLYSIDWQYECELWSTMNMAYCKISYYSRFCLESVGKRTETCIRLAFIRILEITSIILWHKDPLLDNDREISDYTTAVSS
jgi:hypothetical protein